MKKYLNVGYAYPVYFLLILGQYFLAEGLDSLHDSPAGVQAAQPVGGQMNARVTVPGPEKEGSTALANPVKAAAKGR